MNVWLIARKVSEPVLYTVRSDEDMTMYTDRKCVVEFARFTAVMVPVADDLTNRYSERKEKIKEGKLLTQAEKETQKELATTVAEARKG